MSGLVAMGLAEMPAFRMRLEVEPLDDVGGGELSHGDNLSPSS